MQSSKKENALRRLPSIRRILAAVVGAVLLPMLALLVAFGAWNVGLQQEILERDLKQKASELSLAVDGDLKGLVSALVALSATGGPDDDDMSALYTRAAELAAAQGGWIVLSDAANRPVFSTRVPFGSPLSEGVETAALLPLNGARDPTYSDLYRDRTSDELVVSVRVPVLQNGNVIFTLSMAVPSERLDQFLASQALPQAMIATLVDRNDVIIARSHDAEAVVGQPAPRWFSTGSLGEAQGIVEGVSRLGVDVDAAFAHSSLTGWTTMIVQPAKVFQAPVRRAINLIAVGGMTSLLLALAAGAYLGRRITQPLRRLARDAGGIIGGQSPHPAKEPIAEIAKLRTALLNAAQTHHEKVAARLQLEWERESRNVAEAAHQEILRRDARFRRLIDANLIGILVANENELVEANDAFLKIIGYHRDDFDEVKRQWNELTPADYDSYDRNAIIEILDHNECTPYEKAFIHKNGSLIHVLIGCAKVEATDLTWICFVIDRTPQKQAEVDLRTSEERYRALTEAIASLVWVTGADGYASDMPTWRAITGQTVEECRGWGWLDALHPGDRLRVSMAWRRSVEGVEPYDIEYRVRRTDGSFHWYNARGVPVRNGDGSVREWIGVCIDIEGRKVAEERQTLLMAELDHRVRNILASIAAMVSLTAQGATTKEEYAKRLHGRIAAMARTHGLLTKQRWKGASLQRLVRDELAAYGHNAEAMEIRGHPDDVVLRPPPALNLSLILHELATNAAKYGALSIPGGRVAVNWCRLDEGNGSWLRIEWCEDNGPPVIKPTKVGFGCTLIRSALSSEAGAEVALDFDPEGVRCRIVLPLESISPGAGTETTETLAAADAGPSQIRHRL